MTGQQLSTIIAQLQTCEDVDALDKISDLALRRFRTVRQAKANGVGWKCGQVVHLKHKLHHRKPYAEPGTIIKVNPKRLRVDFGQFGIFNVSKTLVEFV